MLYSLLGLFGNECNLMLISIVQLFCLHLILLLFSLHISCKIFDFDLMLVVALDFSLNLCAEIVDEHRMHEILLLHDESPLLVESPLKLILQPPEIFDNSNHVLLQHSIPRLLFLDFPLKQRYLNSLLSFIFVLLLDNFKCLVVARVQGVSLKLLILVTDCYFIKLKA